MNKRLAAALAACITMGIWTASPTYAGPLDSAFRGLGNSSAQTNAAARSARPPLGLQIYCLRNRADCRGGGPAVVPYTAKLANDLQRINRSVNRSIRYRHDGTADVWRVNANVGDCKDYVMNKRQQLIRLGVPSSALRIAAVKNSRGQGHAVLVVKTSKGELVLDNARQQILPKSKTGYRWLAMSSKNPTRWTKL